MESADSRTSDCSSDPLKLASSQELDSDSVASGKDRRGKRCVMIGMFWMWDFDLPRTSQLSRIALALLATASPWELMFS
ncbi:unnamed protein product [Caretta caretta]